MKIEDVKDLLTDPDYEYHMHGTGRSSDDPREQAQVIASIFTKGLRTCAGMLFWTSEFMGDGEEMNQNWETVKETMNHWKHMGSKNIIVVRAPKKYIVESAPEDSEERYGAFYVGRDDGNSELTNYVNPKVILGCYHAETGNFTLNPKFERELSPKTEQDLQQKYQQSLDEFEKWRNASSYLDFSVAPGVKKEHVSEGEQEAPKLSQEEFDALTIDDTERLFD